MKTRAKTRLPRKDVEDVLLETAAKYIKVRGGEVLAVGPIEVQEWPGERPHCYRLAIRFLGRKPMPLGTNNPSQDATQA